jgi:hypothetical protein
MNLINHRGHGGTQRKTKNASTTKPAPDSDPGDTKDHEENHRAAEATRICGSVGCQKRHGFVMGFFVSFGPWQVDELRFSSAFLCVLCG